MKFPAVISFIFLTFSFTITRAQQCRFEKSDGAETATYYEAIDWYKQLDKRSPLVLVKEMGGTDAGYPLHLVLVSGDGKFDVAEWHQAKRLVLLINNGIHPGEPDGIDASMMLVRDIADKKNKVAAQRCIGFYSGIQYRWLFKSWVLLESESKRTAGIRLPRQCSKP